MKEKARTRDWAVFEVVSGQAGCVGGDRPVGDVCSFPPPTPATHSRSWRSGVLGRAGGWVLCQGRPASGSWPPAARPHRDPREAPGKRPSSDAAESGLQVTFPADGLQVDLVRRRAAPVRSEKS